MYKNQKKTWNDIVAIEDFTDSKNKNDLVDWLCIKEQRLSELSSALFFSLCSNRMTNQECFDLIQLMLNNSFRVNPEKLFTDYEHKDHMIYVWNMMRDFFTGKLSYYYEDEYHMVLYRNDCTVWNDSKSIKVQIGRTEEEKDQMNFNQMFRILNHKS